MSATDHIGAGVLGGVGTVAGMMGLTGQCETPFKTGLAVLFGAACYGYAHSKRKVSSAIIGGLGTLIVAFAMQNGAAQRTGGGAPLMPQLNNTTAPTANNTGAMTAPPSYGANPNVPPGGMQPMQPMQPATSR